MRARLAILVTALAVVTAIAPVPAPRRRCASAPRRST